MQEWWEIPGADDRRPMTVQEAARFLRMDEMTTRDGRKRYADPVKTLHRMAVDCRIKKLHVGRQMCFTLGILREYAGRELVKKRRFTPPAP